MITRKQKEETVKAIKDKLTTANFIAFVNFHGLSVAKGQQLRRSLRKAGAEYMVAKKTLLGVAAKELGLEIDKKKLEGEVAMTVSSQGEDMVLAIAKEIVIFAKKNADMLKIIGGLWNKVWMDQAEIKNLASIPSREVLLTRLAFMLSQPVASLVRVLNSVGEKLKENK
ncbi:50S ribosomal protein L10 [Candidatus Giovannonibacteria bacterium RIFCSPHIGHO2_02_43_13]|uniref:Large ribosomal subunit protein uL10 n=1 Tax=Candidatus Giovannonibacteria bacterium RIFCSPHIGHO2_02_43_13 TaxID=1798330 RepID=A0A1F5WRN2_9BACT|nr:MAG: 50S ribosomal protein L10 [Candidatus Giovannonibacteria bacterium RIFCSPHIGHO2_12_FULL_44_42]OGF78319.1 MAG: 50S ribosomal protein L10 [Candidatus Giovannonibacteria bacterium RIFCSPHIGHO2_02_43_13]OGF89528.1 MAG: 50S ribosomal protein L10 [Candidatus Giovannonibacteria bacterium RIFCSPLOWO2_02_FULL_43_54]OGF96665.1 MAG: 50S ribosomal protein L10 [Candidatus Giovannonibacteria bacterium RIFCSPLOWO2_12_FULL_44_32]